MAKPKRKKSAKKSKSAKKGHARKSAKSHKGHKKGAKRASAKKRSGKRRAAKKGARRAKRKNPYFLGKRTARGSNLKGRIIRSKHKGKRLSAKSVRAWRKKHLKGRKYKVANLLHGKKRKARKSRKSAKRRNPGLMLARANGRSKKAHAADKKALKAVASNEKALAKQAKADKKAKKAVSSAKSVTAKVSALSKRVDHLDHKIDRVHSVAKIGIVRIETLRNQLGLPTHSEAAQLRRGFAKAQAEDKATKAAIEASLASKY